MAAPACGNERQGFRSNLVELSNQFVEFKWRRHRGPHNSPGEYAQIAEPLEKRTNSALDETPCGSYERRPLP